MKTKKNELVPAQKNPAPAPAAPDKTVKELIEDFANIRSGLEKYATGLTPLDRRRLKGVGIATQGFISRAFEHAEANPGMLPQYSSIEKFRRNFADFQGFLTLLNLCRQTEKTLWNITLLTANTVYNDALSFYASACEGAKQGINEYETVYKALFPFFKKTKRDGAGPTQKEVKSDVNALLHGKRDGEVIIRNVSPKVTGGEHEVIDGVIKED